MPEPLLPHPDLQRVGNFCACSSGHRACSSYVKAERVATGSGQRVLESVGKIAQEFPNDAIVVKLLSVGFDQRVFTADDTKCIVSNKIDRPLLSLLLVGKGIGMGWTSVPATSEEGDSEKTNFLVML